jgi:adenosylcobinamide-phosphate synthase
MAAALGVALAGPRVYHGIAVREPMISASGRQSASVADIEAGLDMFRRACTVLAVVVLVLAAIA